VGSAAAQTGQRVTAHGSVPTPAHAELLHPKGTQVFRGAYQPEKIRGADRLIVWMPAIRDIMPAGDFREWDAIDAWANSIADHLGAPPVS
jgi:menaquinone-dependent protoporphyrinogen oxidase